MNTLNARIFILGAICVEVACSSARRRADGSESQTGDVIPPETPEEFLDAFNNALSRRYSRCIGGAAENWRAYKSITQIASIKHSIAAGHMSYDQANATQCILSLRDDSCETPILGQPGPCMFALAGQIPAQEICRILDPEFYWDAFPNECARGSQCVARTDEWTGTCQPYAGVGNPCARFLGCAEGLSCYPRYCMPTAGEGAPCSMDPSTGKGHNCGVGLYCEKSPTRLEGVCQKKKTSGACPFGSECAVGYSCRPPFGGGVCTRDKGPGEPCERDRMECWWDEKDDRGGYCRPEGICSLGAQEGETCGRGAQLAYVPTDSGSANVFGVNVGCARGLFCDTVDKVGVCRPQRSVSEACHGGTEQARPACRGSDTVQGLCDARITGKPQCVLQ